MEKEKILEFLRADNNFYTTKILKQHWRESKYSYLHQPRPDYGIMIVLRGSVNFVSEGENLTATAGNIVFLPKGSEYEAIFPDKTEDFLISFDSSFDGISIKAPMKLMQNAPLSCIERFREIVNEKYFESSRELKIKGLFYLLLDAVTSDTESEASGHRRLVNRASMLLGENEELSVAAIAKECAVSESGLRSIFKSQMGITPTKYRLTLKIKRAAYLLEATDMSVAEIAEQLGFFDSAYFCKVFKEYTGVTPRQYSLNKKL